MEGGSKLETNIGSGTEGIKSIMAERIEAAKKNPIFESRLAILEDQLGKFKDEFVRTDRRSIEQIAQEDLILGEILKSSALADNIIEFREMLTQIATTYGKPQEWITDLLAHENAHANVAAETGHEWVGYASVFIKNEAGNLSSIQPLHFTKPSLTWGAKESLEKEIDVLEAPDKYGNRASSFDRDDILKNRERLELIHAREQRDKDRMDEIRRELKSS
ncbi:MAG: hypothetical protein V4467_05075 [Patescibacteria group bacterium]